MEGIVAITVTYNRTKTLERCLSALLSQSRKPDTIIIVDNNSSIAEKERLKMLAENLDNVHIFWLEENLGGAGGFEYGMNECRKLFKPDWYWLMDDDAYPRKDCLEKLLESADGLSNIGYLAPLIYGIDLKEYQWYHHKLIRGRTYQNLPLTTQYDKLLAVSRIDANAFVGPLISAKAVEKVGIADGSMFIYGDDTEYTFRITRQLAGYLVKKAIIDHQDPPIVNNSRDLKSWWKDYYCWRNQYFMVREFQDNRLVRNLAYAELTINLTAVLAAALIKPKYRRVHLLRSYLIIRSIVDGLLNRRGKALDPVKFRQYIEKNQRRYL